MKAKSRMYTLIKIDEGSNLGAVRIRIRSLIAAVKARQRSGKKLPVKSAAYHRRIFTKEMKNKHTILCPQMSPIHFRLFQHTFTYSGFNLVILDAVDPKAVEVGLKYVNNDACYPSILVTGQMIAALQSGKYDINNTSILMSQTGGGCRATNYAAFIRRALKDAGFENVPVITLSVQGLEENPGFKVPLVAIHRALRAAVVGDLLMQCLYRTRPYEAVPGSADALYEKWDAAADLALRHVRRGPYKKLIRGIIKDFDNLPLLPVKKPRIGVVGEIMVKFHPTANNEIVRNIEREGAEANVTSFADFFFYSFSTGIFRHKELAFPKKTEKNARRFVFLLELYRKYMAKQLKKSRRFDPPTDIFTLMDGVEDIVQIGNIMGEGWFLTAEMVELIHSGVPSIACVQPFACLPNHVTGKGMIKELRRRYPNANISAIDYDPGASEVNQLNRLKLLLSNAPIGRHPDEQDDGMIHNPDGTIVKPEIKYADGSMGD